MDREQVLVRLRERILAYAASRIGRDTAEDLAQEVLLLLEQKYAHVQDLEELVPLSFQILRFKLMDLRRKTARRGEYNQVPVEEISLPDSAAGPAERLERKERQERLMEAMNKLDGRCRELFRLKLEGKSFAEIQALLGAASLNTVYTWDFRCRKRLLELMGGSWEASQ